MGSNPIRNLPMPPTNGTARTENQIGIIFYNCCLAYSDLRYSTKSAFSASVSPVLKWTL